MQRNKEFLIYLSVFVCGGLLLLTSFTDAGIIGNLLIYIGIYVLSFLLAKRYLSRSDFNFQKLFSIDIHSLALASFLYFLLFFINAAISLIFREEAADVSFSLHTLIYAGLIVPVFEELFFRGCICTGISKIYGKSAAIFISSLLFALLHYGSSGFIFAFIGGYMFSFLYMQTGSIIPGVILHISNNLISVLILRYPIIFIFAPLVTLLLSIVLFIICKLKKICIEKQDMPVNISFLKSFNFYAAVIAITILRIIGEKI